MPFQSRLFNKTIRQVQRWQDRVGRLWRQARLRANWGIEALLYPLAQITHSLRQGLAQQRDQSFGAAAQRSPSLAFGLRARRLFKRMGQSLRGIQLVKSALLEPANHRTEPLAPALSGARQVAITLVRHTTAWLRRVGSPFQKFSTQLVLRRSGQSRRALADPIADSRVLVPTQIATLPQAIWSWIKAAMVYFFGQDDYDQSLKALFPSSSRIFPESKPGGLSATSLSMVLLPDVGNLVRAVLRVIWRGIQVITPWVWDDHAVASLSPSDSPQPAVLKPSQKFGQVAASPLFNPLDRPLLQTPNGPHWDDLRRMDFEPATTLIDVKATVLGYVESPLRMIWAVLDRAVRWLEDALIAGLHGLWQFVRQVMRDCLAVLSKI